MICIDSQVEFICSKVIIVIFLYLVFKLEMDIFYEVLNQCEIKVLVFSLIDFYVEQFVVKSWNVCVLLDFFEFGNLDFEYLELF